jgi:sialate O-acetylesterase
VKNLIILALILFPAICPAQQDRQTLTLASPIADHMVLQQGQPTSVWGKAKPGTNVTVKFGDQGIKADTDADGNWKVTLEPVPVSAEPAALKVTCSDGSTITVNDILVGEVWMCSGQSNMAWTLSRVGDPVIAQSDLPMIRLFRTADGTSKTIKSDCKGTWQVSTPETAGGFSAVGFHFGKLLYDELKVPIGLIDTSWGGKRVEAFTRREKLLSVDAAIPLIKEWDTVVDRYDPQVAKKNHQAALKKWEQKCEELRANAAEGKEPKLPGRPRIQSHPKLSPNHPSAIYNQKVAPWTGYAIAGTIWYQGESNTGRAAQYQSLLTALIEDWREQWNNPFPFYIVQLANYRAVSNEPGVPDDWAELQHAQSLVAQSVPGCGIAVINDIGLEKNIHPTNKLDVGRRLALLALKKHYAKDLKAFSSPLYQSHKITNADIMVTFDFVGEGLKSRDGGNLKRFEIAGADHKWHWADAEIVSKDTIRVSSAAVTKPLAVRYAWASNPQGANLVNSGDLPASLFRTDDWPLSTEGLLTQANDLRQFDRQLKSQKFTALFNGQDLEGWRNPYDFGEAQVIDNEIRLTANKKFFLVTKEQYSDFVLFADINLPEGKANSGIMFRCHVEPNKVFGYQAECDGSDRCWSAGLYDEGRRGWVWPSKKGRSKVEDFLKYEKESQAFFAQPEIRDALIRTGWNRYKITCRGNRIVIELNGVKVTDIKDETDAKGFIGIQHHGETGQTYRFRNIYIKELK